MKTKQKKGQVQLKEPFTYLVPFFPGVKLPPLDALVLGGKGRGLAEMASLNLPVPPGFIITTKAHLLYRRELGVLPSSFWEEVTQGIQLLEGMTQLRFGAGDQPLLLSVRSGAPVSMPGMMDTVLNVGLNDQTVEAFAKLTVNPKLALDSYRRLISMYSEIVEKIDHRLFVAAIDTFQQKYSLQDLAHASPDHLIELIKTFKEIYRSEKATSFPQDCWEMIQRSINAVFESWNSERANLYRSLNHISDQLGTAVTVETMVFGNKNHRSASGVAFTRNPATGEKGIYGEFLTEAQGEEVVSGARTPLPISSSKKGEETLQKLMPTVFDELSSIVDRLEQHYRDMQDIEFTIDDGKLFMLQTRSAKRTGFAALRSMIQMVDECVIDEEEALLRVSCQHLSHLLAPIFDEKELLAAKGSLVTKGLNAGPGAASGKIALSSKQAIEWAAKGIDTILVRSETNPADFPGMVAARGILTQRGGSTSHAAVVARGMGKPCVVGCNNLVIDEKKKSVRVNDRSLHEGDVISIDGSSGHVYFCALVTSESEVLRCSMKGGGDSQLYQDYLRLMKIADHNRSLEVLANADNPEDLKVALALGAEGIGLCRTEHMFMQKQRLKDVRKMFFSQSQQARLEAIEALLPHQKGDFRTIFKLCQGKRVTVRLLDPPIHEFLPQREDELKELAEELSLPFDELMATHQRLQEHNPMLGHRGCRLGITYPALTKMQVRAMVEALIELKREEKLELSLEIMVPLIATREELIHQKRLIDQEATRLFDLHGIHIDYRVGTMIELPRAALLAGEIALDAEFFSFGTNDLTQTTLGISRDDAMNFLPLYIEGVPIDLGRGERFQIFENDPFETIDQKGVGELMRIALKRGKQSRSTLQCGICGEHGGEEKSIAFCHDLGVDYVSCSPYRIPIARLAAAQAFILAKRRAK